MPGSEPEGEKSSEPELRPASRRRSLTPEQRRLLGTPRAETSEAQPPPPAITRPTPEFSEPATEPAVESEAEPDPVPRRERRSQTTGVSAQEKASRTIEMRQALFVIALLVLVAGVFLAGKKFDAIHYALITRLNAKELEGDPDKFPGASAEELIETGLAAEKRGDWQDAADRFIAAKKKNRSIPGILVRIGRNCLTRDDLDGATIAFDHALRFGENLATASYYRGLIAVRKHDLPAATRYFEAATVAEPFVADFFYYWAEALRLDQHPREAIHRYQQAIERTPAASDGTLCQFKIRLARIEAVEGSKVREEVEEQRKAGPLSVDWLMTDAALQIQAGEIAQATRLIFQARAQGLSGLFLTCAGDIIFRQAAEHHPEIAALVNQPPAPAPAPAATPPL